MAFISMEILPRCFQINHAMIIFIVGYMGSGKTTLSVRLARSLGLEAIDLDKYMEKRLGIPVRMMFEQNGEAYFREQERHYLNELVENNSNMVLSLGGGTPCFYDNMELIKRSGITIYLRANEVLLQHRLENAKNQRPLLKGLKGDSLRSFITSQLLEREKFYLQADIVINAIKIEIEPLREKILALCHSR